MERRKPIWIWTIVFAALLLLAIGTEHFVLSGGITRHDIRQFNNTLHSKQTELLELAKQTKDKLNLTKTNGRPVAVLEQFNEWGRSLENKDMALLVTLKGEPIVWSSNSFGFAPEIASAQTGLVQLPNGWYLVDRLDAAPYVIHMLLLIKSEYKIENGYLRNAYASDFHLPNSFKIQFYKSTGTYDINDRAGQYLFSVKPSVSEPCIYSDLYYPSVLFLLALVALLILLYKLNSNYLIRHSRSKLVALWILLSGIYIAVTRFEFPGSVFMLDLFSPKYFAYSNYWSSLGSFLLFSGFLFFWALCFNRTFNMPEKIKQNPLLRRLSMLLWILVAAALFAGIEWLISIVVLNSSLSFALYRVGQINAFSLLGFFAFAFLFLAFILVTMRIVRIFRKHTTPFEMPVIILFVSALLGAFSALRGHDAPIQIGIFFGILMSIGLFNRNKKAVGRQILILVAYVSVFSLFTLYRLSNLVDENERQIQELKALNLFQEHDPTAELYLIDIDAQIQTDTSVYELMMLSVNDLAAYLSRKYFSGYLREYDLQVTVCDQDDSLRIQPGNILRSCMPFFAEMVEHNGMKIPGTQFYYVENMNGRITYLGHYSIRLHKGQPAHNLYIELNSKLRSEGAGFPELLVPKSANESIHFSNMSYAKYYNGELIDRSGKFVYALNISTYKFPESKFSRNRMGHYEHVVYHTGDKNYIVVTRRIVTLYEYIKSFPYLFVFYFIIGFIALLLSTRTIEMVNFRNSLQTRIQLSIVGVVFVALLLAGTGTMVYNLSEYRNSHKTELATKLNSVSTEIELIAGEFNALSPFISDYLTNELIRVSEVFYTDINIFNTQGQLMATSRPEIFEKGLISKQMHIKALTYLGQYQHARFIHDENVGRMKFLSAYVPLVNQTGQTIGFINIPYFTHQQQFNQQVAMFIAAFINLYVFLLMMSILVAYYISSHITEPLKLIRDNVRSVQLGRSTKPIAYQSDDEIGMLVHEYNQKLRELALSTELLARSERETAWREMAKQIAHEIKNPLTPMKLNIQFLQRTQNIHSPDYVEKMNRITDTLIEQIDNLSSIATEFSNFAKMPNAKNTLFDPARRTHDTVNLYAETGQSQIVVEFDLESKIRVNADKEQFSRALINLIRNAIQAIPQSREGRIRIQMKDFGTNVEISISDNGKGIPSDLCDKIFVPNFTTKSSGAGLGLAITKNIIESFGGTIRFETKEQIGTTFFINLPIAERIS